MDRITRVAIALGSNLGDRRGHLDYAASRLGSILSNIRVSTSVDTEPVGVPGRQPTAQEQELSAAFLAAQTDRYRKEQQTNPERSALVDLCQAIFSMSEFVYVD